MGRWRRRQCSPTRDHTPTTPQGMQLTRALGSSSPVVRVLVLCRYRCNRKSEMERWVVIVIVSCRENGESSSQRQDHLVAAPSSPFPTTSIHYKKRRNERRRDLNLHAYETSLSAFRAGRQGAITSITFHSGVETSDHCVKNGSERADYEKEDGGYLLCLQVAQAMECDFLLLPDRPPGC